MIIRRLNAKDKKMLSIIDENIHSANVPSGSAPDENELVASLFDHASVFVFVFAVTFMLIFVVILVMSLIMVFFVISISRISGAAVSVSMTRLICRYICFIIPSVAHEIDGTVAGVVFMTMLFPLFGVTGRNMDIERWRRGYTHGYGSNQNRLGINNLRLWKISNIYLAIKARLTDADRHTNIGCLCCDGKKYCRNTNENKTFHN